MKVADLYIRVSTDEQADNLYQKIHRDIYTKEDFEAFQASSFLI